MHIAPEILFVSTGVETEVAVDLAVHPQAETCCYPCPWVFNDVLVLNLCLGKTLLKLVLSLL